jgi:hypothetical protein
LDDAQLTALGEALARAEPAEPPPHRS